MFCFLWFIIYDVITQTRVDIMAQTLFGF